MYTFSRGNKYQLIEKSSLWDGTEAAVVVPEVAKQHDISLFILCSAVVIDFRVLVSARASFWLDKNIRKLFESFHEDLPKPALFLLTTLYMYM